MLAALDDRELKLERLKHRSEQEEQLKQYRQAMAEHNAAQVQILSAQLEQSSARRSSESRTSCCALACAPFDGVVVSGDLSQSLGRRWSAARSCTRSRRCPHFA